MAEKKPVEFEPESRPEPTAAQVNKSPSSIPAPKKPQYQFSKVPMISSSEEEDEYEPDLSDPNVKPLASNPMVGSQKSTARKPISEPSATGPGFPVMLTGSKRAPAEDKASEVKDKKRLKPKTEPVISEKKWSVNNDGMKEKLFRRLWSEDDEILILKGMTDYVAKKNSDPVADLNAFHDFIKDLIVDVTKVQLQDYIGRLRKKYEKNKGKERTLAKANEQKAYELSKKIWGGNNGNPKANGSAVRNWAVKVESRDLKEAKREEIENGDIKMVAVTSENFDGAKVKSENFDGTKVKSENFDRPHVGKRGLKCEAEFFEGDKMVKIAREWRKLEMEEAELYVKKLDLMSMQMKVVLDALKSSDWHTLSRIILPF